MPQADRFRAGTPSSSGWFQGRTDHLNAGTRPVFFKKKQPIEAPVLHAADTDFDEIVLQGGGITLVDFWAAWCGPCRMMAPILDEIAIEFESRGVRVVKVNTEEAPETAERFSITSIPTLIFFRDGEPLFQASGLVAKPVLQRELAELVAGGGTPA